MRWRGRERRGATIANDTRSAIRVLSGASAGADSGQASQWRTCDAGALWALLSGAPASAVTTTASLALAEAQNRWPSPCAACSGDATRLKRMARSANRPRPSSPSRLLPFFVIAAAPSCLSTSRVAVRRRKYSSFRLIDAMLERRPSQLGGKRALCSVVLLRRHRALTLRVEKELRKTQAKRAHLQCRRRADR